MTERQLGHSHVFEVKSGFLIEPKTPFSIDLSLVCWAFDAQNLTVPIGIPEKGVGDGAYGGWTDHAGLCEGEG